MKNKIQKYKIKIIVTLFVLVTIQALFSYVFVFESSSRMINSMLRESLLSAQSSIGTWKFFNEKQSSEYSQSNNENSLIVIEFEGVPTSVTVSKAPLKYNKHFAYSFTLDDGKDNAYTAAYPLLNGGRSSETGATYSGLFYTDGCGNKISFKAGIAINSVNTKGVDIHQGTPGSMTWAQIRELYDKDWDVLNHGYAHKSGTGTDYKFEVEENIRYVKSKTGIELTQFVIPSGDVNYTTYAFNAGMKAVYNQDADFPGTDGYRINPDVPLVKFTLYRQFLNDDNYSNFSTKVDHVAAKSNASDCYWYSEFTHHVSVKKQGGSLVFATFKSHMDNIERKYGAKGLDNIWMAPLQEVYEYLSVREKSVISETTENNKVFENVNFNSVPTDLRRYSMTLRVESDQNISNVECNGASKITFKGTGNNKIINIEWDMHPSQISTGIRDSKSGHHLKLFPNPADNEVTLSFPEVGVKEVYVIIIDQKGVEYALGKHKVVNSSTLVNLGSLQINKGNYIIKAFSPDNDIQYTAHLHKN